MWQNAHYIPLGVRWCAMHIFLFLRLYNFIDRIVRIYIFFKNFRSLLFYSLAQVFITFNISDVFLLNKLMSKYGKRIVLVFYIYCINLKKKVKVLIFSFIPCHLFFVSTATNFFIHSWTGLFWKNTAYRLLVFLHLMPFLFLAYANISFKFL